MPVLQHGTAYWRALLRRVREGRHSRVGGFVSDSILGRAAPLGR
ncbi:MAG: hypothetical protein JWM49_1035 [Microbacteriaceae bacterium]|nr:hypothetical protein [Microbacteriaceae bacterium]